MTGSFHSLLKRQLKRFFGREDLVPDALLPFIRAVNEAYRQSDDDRGMLERSLELSSQELLQVNSELRAIFQALPDLLFRLDPHGVILDFKGGKNTDFFIPPEELIGKRIQDVPLRDLGERFDQAIDQVRKTRQVEVIDYSLKMNQLENFYEARVLPHLDNQIIVILRNISDRKKTEQELYQSQQMLKYVLDNIPQFIFWKDRNSVYLGCNRNFSRVAGVGSPEEIIGKTDRELAWDPKQAEFFIEVDRRVMESDQAELHIIEPQSQADGKQAWIDTNKVPLHDADGNVVGILGTYEDITARKEAEQEQTRRVERAQKQHHAIVQLATHDSMISGDFQRAAKEATKIVADIMDLERVSVWLMSPDRTWMECITLWEKTNRRHSSGMTLEKSNYPRYFNTLIIDRAIDAVDACSDERTSEFRDGYLVPNRIVSMLDAAIRVRGDVVGVVCCEHLDHPRRWQPDEITFIGQVADQIAQALQNSERARTEEEKDKLRQQLYQSQKMEAIGRLAGGVAHDFNNLLTGINGYTEMIISGLSPDDPLYDDLKEILHAGERAASLTNQLLAFSRRQVIQPRVIHLNKVIARSQKMISRIIGEDVELEFIQGPDLWDIKADPVQIDQILVNLATNGRDAMPQGGKLTIQTANAFLDRNDSMVRETSVSGEFIMLSVSDNGNGIPEEIREYLFEPFYTTKEIGQGTGLGLSTVYGIVKQNNAYIQVDSQRGRGTTFRIYFPRAASPEADEGKTEPGALFRGRETILLVEDEDMVRGLARKILQSNGYLILEASEGFEAMNISRRYNQPIDLLLTDVVMPQMNGKDLYVALREQRPRLKALFMSGYNEDVITHHGILEEKTQFIQKPFSVDLLSRRVREVLDLVL